METRAKLARQIAIGHSNSLDWARDHTHLQKLCRERGFSEFEVEGDSFGVPGITDLADMLASAPAPAYRPTLTNET